MPADTRGGGAFLGTIGFLLLVLAQFAVAPLLGGPVRVDFIVIALLFAAVRMRPGLAALTGLTLGVVIDALAPAHFGAAMLILTLIGVGASWLRAAFFGDNLGLTALLLIGGRFAFDVAYTLMTGATIGGSLLMTLGVWAPLSALATGVAGVVLLTLFRPLFRAKGS